MPPPTGSPTVTPKTSPTLTRTSIPPQPSATGTQPTLTATTQPASTSTRPVPTSPQATPIPPTQTAQAIATETSAAATSTYGAPLIQIPTNPGSTAQVTPSQLSQSTAAAGQTPTPLAVDSSGSNLGLFGLVGGGMVLVLLVAGGIWLSRRRGQVKE